jgi:predicted nucleic acid-binding protein
LSNAKDKKAGVDTNVLIYALRSVDPPSHEVRERQKRSQLLIRALDDEGWQIVVPVVSLAELLVDVDSNRQNSVISEFQQRFLCQSFNPPAALWAARLWIQHRKLPKNQQLKRTILKADVQIVASAKVGGATDFYSHDVKCRRLATLAGLSAHDLPMNHPNLFVDREIRQTED